METLIEILTDEVKDNVYGVLSLKPKKVIFLVEKDKEEQYLNIKKFLLKYLPDIEIIKEIVQFDNYEKVRNAILSLFTNKDCCLDVTGGNDRIRLPFMSIASSKGIPCCFIDVNKKDMILFNDAIKRIEMNYPVLDVEDILMLNGAMKIKEVNYPMPSQIPFVEQVIRIAFDNIYEWKKVCSYISYACSHYYHKSGLIIVPEKIHAGNALLKVNWKIMNDLYDIGVFGEYRFEHHKIYFRFKDKRIKYIFEKQGNALEIFTYLEFEKSNMFEEVDMSVEIDWDGEGKENVINEIDVIARKDRKIYFISCKCTDVKTEYLNEIVFLANNFGKKDIIPVIVTTQHQTKIARSTLDRARRMNCIIIDREDIEKHNMIEKIINEE